MERLWALHIGIAQWPAWQKDIVSASLDGPLAVQSNRCAPFEKLLYDSSLFVESPGGWPSQRREWS
jgi:hypothetical protein